VKPLPPAGGPSYKTPVLAIRRTGGWRALPVPLVAERAETPVPLVATRTRPLGVFNVHVDGGPVALSVRTDPPAAWLDPGTQPAASCGVVYAFWFAWYAMHPEGSIVTQQGTGS